jgi:hypothetical protein
MSHIFLSLRSNLLRASMPKLKQPCNSISKNRGGQPYNAVKVATI